MGRLCAVLTLVVITGCQLSGTASRTAAPSPSPHTAVTSIVFQRNDVPSSLTSCPGSGSIASYITTLQTSDAALARSVSTQWLALQRGGALEAAIAVFTSDQAACTKELGASGAIKAATSVVLAFGDEGQADRAWQDGLFDFTPPAPGELPPGVTRGSGTGLGPSSWTYSRAPVRLASWRRSIFVALVVLTNLDGATFTTATSAVDARLH